MIRLPVARRLIVLLLAYEVVLLLPPKIWRRRQAERSQSEQTKVMDVALSMMTETVRLLPHTCTGPGYCKDEKGFYHYAEQMNPLLHSRTSTSSTDNPVSSSVLQVTHRTHAQVESCLAHKHIVFIGDSRVRYGYMTLAHFLKTGKWLKCEDQVVKGDDLCFLIQGRQGIAYDKNITWNDWFEETNRALHQQHQQDDPTNKETIYYHGQRQVEVCDCYRPRNGKVHKSVENRFFHRVTPYGSIRITYLQSFVNRIQYHRQRFLPFVPFPIDDDNAANTTMTHKKKETKTTKTTATQRCTPGHCSHRYKTMSLSRGLEKLVPRFNPTHVFANGGWEDKDITCELKAFAQVHPNIEVTYVTTPAERGWPMPSNPSKYTSSALQKACPDYSTITTSNGNNHGVRLLDRYEFSVGVNETWFWDNLHHNSLLNQVYVEKVLDHICGATTTTAGGKNQETSKRSPASISLA